MNAPAPLPIDARFAGAAAAFRRFFREVREAFLEREAVLTQLELALLCKEHVLIIGPPGTAKSAIASAVLGRILDETTRKPSLFAKQLAENTVQTDLIGPVNFKVLTETGRTEYLMEEGMLGAVHAFLDEVFDGRDMLLRSILNVLHERELKHGTKVTIGRCECAVMTSNRYLSEVVQRSPETLQAFADRISFSCFTPKSFARKSSRAQMLQRALGGERPALVEMLSLQQLDILQDATSKVDVPPVVSDGLEQLADSLERALQAQVTKLPDYVPTKYFSQRTLVKALWALRAAVVRDRIFRRPERPLVAQVEDLAELRHFFLLGGPPPNEVEPLLKASSDPRERAQLEIIRVENRVFDEVLARTLPGLAEAAAREASDFDLAGETAAAEGLSRTWAPAVAATLAESLRAKLIPGPRYHETRAPLLRAAARLVAAMERRLDRGAASQADPKASAQLLTSFVPVLELVRGVPELQDNAPAIARGLVQLCAQSAELSAIAAEGTQFEDKLRLEDVAEQAQQADDEFSKLQVLLETASVYAPEEVARVRAGLGTMKDRVAAALRRRAVRTFAPQTRRGDPLEALAQDSRKLRSLEESLARLSAGMRGLRQELLLPMAEQLVKQVIANPSHARIEQLGFALAQVMEDLRREGAPVAVALEAARPDLEVRLAEQARALSKSPRAQAIDAARAGNGEAAAAYRTLAQSGPDGEVVALAQLEEALARAGARGAVPPVVREAVQTAELAWLSARITYLREWLKQLLGTLPAAPSIKKGNEAERVFDALVKSRFPMLVTREGELVRLKGIAERFLEPQGPNSAAASALVAAITRIAEDFGAYSRAVLDAR